MKACLISLGCPKNLTDSEVLMGKLALSGYALTTDHKEADIIIVNTCAFLKSARDESVSTIKQIAKAKKRRENLYCRVPPRTFRKAGNPARAGKRHKQEDKRSRA